MCAGQASSRCCAARGGATLPTPYAPMLPPCRRHSSSLACHFLDFDRALEITPLGIVILRAFFDRLGRRRRQRRDGVRAHGWRFKARDRPGWRFKARDRPGWWREEWDAWCAARWKGGDRHDGLPATD